MKLPLLKTGSKLIMAFDLQSQNTLSLQKICFEKSFFAITIVNTKVRLGYVSLGKVRLGYELFCNNYDEHKG